MEIRQNKTYTYTYTYTDIHIHCPKSTFYIKSVEKSPKLDLGAPIAHDHQTARVQQGLGMVMLYVRSARGVPPLTFIAFRMDPDLEFTEK